MSSRIVIKLYDEDKVVDEIVGSLLFNLKDCMNINVSSPSGLISAIGR